MAQATNASHTADIKSQIDRNLERRSVMADATIGTSLIAGLFDPINLVALPVGGPVASVGRAALRDAEEINHREISDDELKKNQAIKELVVERKKNEELRRKLLVWYLLLGFFVWTGFTLLYPYLGQIWEKIK